MPFGIEQICAHYINTLWISEVEKRKTLLITCNEILVIIIILFPFFVRAISQRWLDRFS
jgi:hypothetical protein